MITPYLSMSLPDVLITAGSAYASQINQAFLVLDTLVGQGTTPSQLNINADLSFQNNGAVNVRAVRFTNTGSLSAPADIGTLYNLSGSLYFNNNSGQAVQITSGSAIVAANGNIGGLTSTSASVTFSPVTNAFVFQSSPGNLAILSASTLSLVSLNVGGTLTASNALLPNVMQLSASQAYLPSVSLLTASSARLTNASFINASVLSASNAQLSNVSLLTASNARIANASFVNASVLTASNAALTNAQIGTGTATTFNATTLTGSAALIPTLNTTTATVTTLTSTDAALTTMTASAGIRTPYASYEGTGRVIVNSNSSAQILSCSGDIVAQGGFKCILGPAMNFINNATLPTVETPMAIPLFNYTGTSTIQRFTWVAPYPGSVMALSAYNIAGSFPLTTTTIVTAYKNTVNALLSLTIASGDYGGSINAAKDTYTFVAGDIITIWIRFGSGLTSQTCGYQAHLVVEI